MVLRTSALALVVWLIAHPAMAVELYWNDTTGIRHRSLDDPSIQTLYDTFETRGLAVEPAAKQLIWSDILPLGGPMPGGTIRSGGTSGGPVDDLVQGLSNPAAVAIDPLHDKLYWTDLGDANQPGGVYIADRDGSNAQQLISEEWLSEISGIAVDLKREKIYFSYINPLIDALQAGGIAMAELDGTSIEPIVTGLDRPKGLALDEEGGRLYWAHQLHGDEPMGIIQMVGLETLEPQTIHGGLVEPVAVALDPDAHFLYWLDAGTGSIQRTGASGGLPFFEDIVTGLDQPTALVVVPEPAAGWCALVAGWAMVRAVQSNRRRASSTRSAAQAR